MNREVKKKWVAALRSGEYRQGQRRLVQEKSSGYSYCCLGVLCEVMGARRARASSDSVALDFEYGGDREDAILPAALATEVGLDVNPAVDVEGLTNLGELKPYVLLGGNVTLAALNDSGNYDFDEIADVIEQAF